MCSRHFSYAAMLLVLAVAYFGAAKAGFDHHFVKPVDPKDLDSLLASV
jgi:hypothetical protein